MPSQHERLMAEATQARAQHELSKAEDTLQSADRTSLLVHTNGVSKPRRRNCICLRE